MMIELRGSPTTEGTRTASSGTAGSGGSHYGWTALRFAPSRSAADFGSDEHYVACGLANKTRSSAQEWVQS